MEQEKRKGGLEEGLPIWVESTMTLQEWKARFRKYPSSSKPLPPQYNPDHHGGGKWRANMGNFLKPEHIVLINARIDTLLLLTKAKAFQNAKVLNL